MAPQGLEKIESAPGNGMGSAASNPQDLAHRRAAARARLRLTSLRAAAQARECHGRGWGGNFSSSQTFEKSRIVIGIVTRPTGACAPDSDRPGGGQHLVGVTGNFHPSP